MRYLSVCSGIEAATAAWHLLGWECAGVSEIEKFPRAVLEQRLGARPVEWDHRYAAGQNSIPLFGDFTKIKEHHVGSIDLLVGGTPCQSFSIAGLRGGLDDDRGNLALEYLRLADRTRPRWLVWENVPGVLSSNGGRDFGAILGGMAELGYGFAYAVLDAQWFGVPQRRRRVFVVGYLGDWRLAAAVLFERESLRGDPPPRREAGKVAPTIPSRSTAGGSLGTDFDLDGGLTAVSDEYAASVAPTLSSRASYDRGDGSEPIVAHSLRGEGFDASEDGTGRGTPIVPAEQPFTLTERGRDGGSNLEYRQDGTANAILTPNGGRNGMGVGAIAIQERAVSENPDHGPDGKGWRDDGQAYTLEARSTAQAIAFSAKDHGGDAAVDVSPTLRY